MTKVFIRKQSYLVIARLSH